MRGTGIVSICCLLFATLLVICAVGTLAGSSGYQGIRSKPRSIRGFKNVALSTARGFGKRGNQEMDLITSGSGFNDEHSDKTIESLPVDWFVQEVQNNAELARILVSKFLDTNHDGILTADELLRPTY